MATRPSATDKIFFLAARSGCRNICDPSIKHPGAARAPATVNLTPRHQAPESAPLSAGCAANRNVSRSITAIPTLEARMRGGQATSGQTLTVRGAHAHSQPPEGQSRPSGHSRLPAQSGSIGEGQLETLRTAKAWPLFQRTRWPRCDATWTAISPISPYFCEQENPRQAAFERAERATRRHRAPAAGKSGRRRDPFLRRSSHAKSGTRRALARSPLLTGAPGPREWAKTTRARTRQERATAACAARIIDFGLGPPASSKGQSPD